MSACRRMSSSSLDVILPNAGMMRRRSGGGRPPGVTLCGDISGLVDFSSLEAMGSARSPGTFYAGRRRRGRLPPAKISKLAHIR